MWRPGFTQFLSIMTDLWLRSIHRSRLFFEDLPDIHQRRERRATTKSSTEETRGKRPRYYLQNFHFQSGGWMTDDFR